MAYEPIRGKDVLFQIMVGEYYYNYACAMTVSVDFSMETKLTKTIGDGVWKRRRGQSLDYKINIEGATIIFEGQPGAFSILEYFKNMADVAYRILFTNSEGEYRIIEGTALPTNVSLSGESEGHATDSITLEGNGEPDIRDSVSRCDAEITSITYNGGIGPVGNFNIDGLEEPDFITRYDYVVDSDGVQSVFTDGTFPTDFNATVPGALGSTHTITITPICENGYPGNPISKTFNKGFPS